LGCETPDEAKEQYVLPSLELLRKEISLFEFHDQKILTDMIAEVKSHLQKSSDNPENDTIPPPESKPPPPPKTEETSSESKPFFTFFDRDKEKEKSKETDKPPSPPIPTISVSKEDSSLTPAPSVTASEQPQTTPEESRFLNFSTRFASFWGDKK